MHKCWNCGTEHEDIAADAAYNRGYSDGYKEAEKYYTNSCFSCGYAGEWSTWVCDDCIKNNTDEEDDDED